MYKRQGLVIATLIQTNNTLQYYYPQLPYIKVKPFDISHLFNERPWNAVAGFPIAFHPCVIGLTYFIPLDISFSCWFFFLFRKGQQVLAAAISTGGGSVWGPSDRYPAIAEQGVGAWIGLALLSLWIQPYQSLLLWVFLLNFLLDNFFQTNMRQVEFPHMPHGRQQKNF